MAHMIPNINPNMIENNGEKAFYTAAQRLPNGYTVVYSYKYQYKDNIEMMDQIREADFVIVHPSLGFLVVEVKQGDIGYINGIWNEYKGSDYKPLRKDPVEQAQRSMFAILDLYKEKAKGNFPLKIKYAVCFPECSKICGQCPNELDENSVFLFDDMQNLEEKIIRLFDAGGRKQEIEATNLLIDKVLAPSFKVYASLEDRIDIFHKMSDLVLTEEQQRILEETELDKRKIFFGSAGTGKTFLAKTKAKMLADEGKKVFLTCFNRNLAKFEFAELTPKVTSLNFLDFIEEFLNEKGYDLKVPDIPEDISNYYDNTLPSLAFDYFMDLPEKEKYDAIIVDEGQDFRENWITCIESMLKKDGEFYLFADPNQNLFYSGIENLKLIPVSKQKLTRNLRNTEEVNGWISTLIPSIHLKSSLKGGVPVKHIKWTTMQEEKRFIEDELGRLVSQGVNPKHIQILSPHKQEKSSLAGLSRIKEWPIAKLGEAKANSIKFDTIRSFKGLEADIVFLIDIKEGSPVCTRSDIYVGGSRARFMLYIFNYGD